MAWGPVSPIAGPLASGDVSEISNLTRHVSMLSRVKQQRLPVNY